MWGWIVESQIGIYVQIFIYITWPEQEYIFYESVRAWPPRNRITSPSAVSRVRRKKARWYEWNASVAHLLKRCYSIALIFYSDKRVSGLRAPTPPPLKNPWIRSWTVSGVIHVVPLSGNHLPVVRHPQQKHGDNQECAAADGGQADRQEVDDLLEATKLPQLHQDLVKIHRFCRRCPLSVLL